MNTMHPRILCIDADAYAADLIMERLRNSDIEWEITCVSTGRDAFQRLTNEDFDLCVLEYALPDMNGAQLCSLMQYMGSEVPMLFFTPICGPRDRQYAEAAGAAAFLSKPHDVGMFVETATRLLVQKRLLSRKARSEWAKAA
jgi:CheY-like chemotaxis protein